jgi:hypothetical protein
MKDWSRIVGERSSRPQKAVPGPSSPPVPPPEFDSEDDEQSEDEVQDSLEPSLEDELTSSLAGLCREGGVALVRFLASKTISTTPENPKEWTYRDILTLPEESLKEWKAACERELDTLHKRSVFRLVERPRGRKVINNCWVFDVKDDGRK